MCSRKNNENIQLDAPLQISPDTLTSWTNCTFSPSSKFPRGEYLVIVSYHDGSNMFPSQLIGCTLDGQGVANGMRFECIDAADDEAETK